MSEQYDIYLNRHKTNVKKGLDWIEQYLPEILLGKDKYDYQWQIGMAHDQSKTDQDEYAAYDAYFYGGNRSFECVQEFNKAWLAHIHKNPHHWQHWVLINDDPNEGIKALNMPYNYIIEMICDWWSFSWNSGNLHEIFSWYDEHKSHMILGDKTRDIVESILDQIKIRLELGYLGDK